MSGDTERRGGEIDRKQARLILGERTSETMEECSRGCQRVEKQNNVPELEVQREKVTSEQLQKADVRTVSETSEQHDGLCQRSDTG